MCGDVGKQWYRWKCPYPQTPPAQTCFLCDVIKGAAHFTKWNCEHCLHTHCKWWQRHVSEMIVALKLQIHLRVVQGSHLLMSCKCGICFQVNFFSHFERGQSWREEMISCCKPQLACCTCGEMGPWLNFWHSAMQCHPGRCCAGRSNTCKLHANGVILFLTWSSRWRKLLSSTFQL